MKIKNSISILIALLAILSTETEAGSFTLSNTTTGLFDASSSTRSVSVTGSESGFGSGIVSDVNISINFAKADGESFAPPFPTGTPFFNEIVFSLSHDATTVALITANSWGNGSGLFDGTITFDQSALQFVNFTTSPQAGTFKPVASGNLDNFLGLSALGQWDLFIQDTASADALRFRSFDLAISTRDDSTVPEPGTIALLGIGLMGAFFSYRQKNRARRTRL